MAGTTGVPAGGAMPRRSAGQERGDAVQALVEAQLHAPEGAPPPGGWLGQQLDRLQRLLALRDAHEAHLNDEGRRLLDHAIFTTFVDCRDLGGEARAAALLAPSAEHAAPAAVAAEAESPGDD
jgi:hypothetical protein